MKFLEKEWRNGDRLVCPGKASTFSGRQTHQGKSQNLVARSVRGKETELLKPDDKAIIRMVSEYLGRKEQVNA